jgi:hypothetical protein
VSEESRPESEETHKVKVHDKRMFTPDGQLREEYSFLDDPAREPPPSPEPQPEPERPPDEPPAPDPERPPDRSREPERRDPAPGRPPIELPPTQEPGGGPSFLDLVAVLAEPASIYLQQAQAAGVDEADVRRQSLELARLHIDLLDVLKTKTAGRLVVQESNVLEDALYQLRMAYVHLRG